MTLAVLALYALLEYAYLSNTKDAYIEVYRAMLRDPSHTIQLDSYALLAYASLYIAMSEFIFPYVKTPGVTYGDALRRGAIVGLVIYGVYNFTNRATLGKAFEEGLLWQDLSWGVSIMAIVALASLFMHRQR